jgi:polyisoprenoid-binding protein YceI
MTSIKTTDIESPEWSKKLDDHLMNEDFFYTDSFPKATLKIKACEVIDLYLINPTSIITADLTIRGITNEIIFPVSIIKSDNDYRATGSIDIDRTLYNIRYKSKKFFKELSDKFIYDVFTINFSIKTNKTTSH